MKSIKLFAAAAAATTLFAAHAWAGTACHDVTVQSTITAVDPMMPLGNYAGMAQLSLGAESSFPAGVLFTPLQVKMVEDGTVHLTGRLTFDLGAMGSVVAEDNAILSPTETPYVYRMNTRLENLTGTGIFTGVVGRFTDHGEFYMLTATLNAAAEGRLCW